MGAAHRRNKINRDRGWSEEVPPIPVSKIDAELYGALREAEGDNALLINNQIHIGPFTLTSTGLQIQAGATQDEWSKVGELLFRLEGSIQWLIGDWLAYGANFGYGDVKKLAIEMGREPGTFWDYAWVCRQIETSIRIEVLSFGHHRLVASYTPEEQAEYLKYAAYGEEKPLSVARFRQWIKSVRGELPEKASEVYTYVVPEPVAADNFFKFYRRDKAEAEAYIRRLQQWTTAILEQYFSKGDDA